jgi:hypothetical protein
MTDEPVYDVLPKLRESIATSGVGKHPGPQYHDGNEPPRLPRRGLAAADQHAVASAHRAAIRQTARKEHPFDNPRAPRTA